MNPRGGQRADIPLSDAVRQEVSGHHLDDEQLQQLQAMQVAVLGEDTEPTLRRLFLGAGLATCAVVILFATLLWQGVEPTPDNPARAIAIEVASNHLKLKPLDIAADSMREMRQFFTQLDFLPINPSTAGAGPGITESALLGGRYCSIAGVTAAQLRYQGEGENLSTLYQVGYDPALHGEVPSVRDGETPLELHEKGLHIFLWREKGLLMALVEEN